MIRTPRILVIIVLLVGTNALFGSERLAAQTEGQSSETDIDQRFQHVDRMLASIPSLAESDRDAMCFRIDEQLLLLQDDLNALANQKVREMDGLAEGPVYAHALQERLDRALELSEARIDALGERIHEELSAFEKFASSPKAYISQAFVHDLRRVRLRYLEATLDQLESRTALGLPDSIEMRARLESIVDLAGQRLAGQIRLDAMTSEELRSRITADPDDGALREALQAVERKQTGNLDAMRSVITLQSRLQMDTTEYRALQAQQRGLIGAELLDRRVFGNVLRERMKLIRESVLTAGPDLLLRLLAFVVVLLLAWLVARGIRAVVHHVMSRKSVELGDLRERTLVSISFGLTLIVGAVIALSTLGISLGPMLAGLGIVSVVVGFALQESLGNLAAGGMILITRPYDMNDHIRLGSAEGTVKDMSLIATTIASFDNTMLVIPNRQVWNATIMNFTRAAIRRVDVEVSIPSDADFGEVERILRGIIADDDRIRSEPAPLVHFGNMGDSAVSFWVRAWVDTPRYGEVSTALKRGITQRLRKANIDIS